MKRERYHTTVTGQRATRRIRWFSPKGIIHENDRKYVAAFVFATLGETGFKLRAITSQFGLDKRGQWVVPGVTDVESMHYLSAYSVGLEVGKMEHGANHLISQLNEHLDRQREQQWMPSMGLDRGNLSMLKQVEDQATEHLPINRIYQAGDEPN